MAVLPAHSGKAVPECYRSLMSDPNSDIIDMYPSVLKVDMNMQAMAWLGVELLPFIETERFIKALEKADEGETKLTPEERERNINKEHDELFFIHFKDVSYNKRMIYSMPYSEHGLLDFFPELAQTIENETKESMSIQALVQNDKKYNATFGANDLLDGEVLEKEKGLPLGDNSKINITEEFSFSIENNIVKEACFLSPGHHSYFAGLLEGVEMPKPEIEYDDWLWINRR
jgi:5'-3' exonuclease